MANRQTRNRATSSIGSFANDFKEFLMRGNVVDLAVAVVLGAAFNAIVTQGYFILKTRLSVSNPNWQQR